MATHFIKELNIIFLLSLGGIYLENLNLKRKSNISKCTFGLLRCRTQNNDQVTNFNSLAAELDMKKRRIII